MKILGKMVKLAPRVERVTVGTDEAGAPVVLEVRAAPLGAEERITASMPLPEAPPKGVQRDDRGQQVKGPDGRPVMMRDTSAPSYQHALMVRQRAVATALLLECLGSQVAFDADRKNFATEVDYFEAIIAEWTAAGVDSGAFLRLLNAMNRVNSGAVTADEHDAAKRALGVDPDAPN